MGPAADTLADLDATAQAELVRTSEATPSELVEAAIARIERLNPQLNAVIHRLYEKARAAAASPELPDGPFRGVPFLVKDIVCHTAGDPYHCGMRVLRDIDWHEQTDSYLAARFRRAGFVFVGKTNTPELAFSPTTEPLAYGPSRNPWNPALSTSGSSGGAAAAVASRMVAAAHGNDMGGSIRTPASACGLVGLKPTRARTTLGPNFGEFWWQTTHEHVLTRTVRDTAGILDATRGPAPGDPYTAPAPERPYAEEVGRDPGRLRIGLRTERPALSGSTHPVHADCIRAVESAARVLEGLGHHVEPASPTTLDASDDGSLLTVFCASIAREIDRWSERIGRTIGPDEVERTTQMAVEMGRATSATRYVEATESLSLYSRGLAAWWEDGWDVLLTPTVAEPPWPLGPLGPHGGEAIEVMARWTSMSPFCMSFNVSGQPAISLPLHWNDEGLPIGVQAVAAYGREDVLLRLASQLEQAMPWKERRPLIHA
ncbi:MAG TPA: amidase [Candidatus Limnocylindrales bacterium]|nr:amidase [Candidatus Limnocylindrales bacterium]